MTVKFASAYVTATGHFLPGAPIDNENIDRFIAPLGTRCAKVKRRILADNGILTRHYAIDETGQTTHGAAEVASRAARACLEASEVTLSDVSVLCTGSTGGDLAVPGFANMVQGELGAGPMLTSSHQGVCASGMAALQHAASALALGTHRHGLVVGCELPSRMFKRSRFAPREYQADFAAHFLRYMLSDGAGALLLSKRPRREGLSLKLDWLHARSFGGDHPVCMQIGGAPDGKSGYLDYPSLADAEQAGAFLLRQDLRLLPRLFELGVHEYVELIRKELIVPDQVDHFLCHYSSAKFAPVVEELMQKSGFEIPRTRWYSDLERRGNTGSASIFIMLDDFMREHTLRPGERILCFVPESGRFTVSFAQLTVVGPDGAASEPKIAPPHSPNQAHSKRMGALIAELAGVWHDYQSQLRRTPMFRRITTSRFTRDDYVGWMSAWIPQVRAGSHWMRKARENLREPFLGLSRLIGEHARDEQDDYQILFDDYRAAGGTHTNLEALQRNPGGEALNAFMFSSADQPNPIGLLGAIYIIEGTGQQVIPQLLPSLRRQLDLPERAFRFLRYHGENDQAHLARWLEAVEIVLAADPTPASARRIVETARATADLYLLQFRCVMTEDHA
jgi:3-oxoacyl-[acyl-carrier-protein] synthase-3